MTGSTVTDILAFATSHPDYWKELLTGDFAPPELNEEEQAALDIAREIVKEQATELLHLCGQRAVTKLGASKVTQQRFRKSAIADNLGLRIVPAKRLQRLLYSARVDLDVNEGGDRVQLYASLAVKKGYHDDVQCALTAQGTAFEVDNYYIYPPSHRLEEGMAFDELATKVVDDLRRLLEGVSAVKIG